MKTAVSLLNSPKRRVDLTSIPVEEDAKSLIEAIGGEVCCVMTETESGDIVYKRGYPRFNAYHENEAPMIRIYMAIDDKWHSVSVDRVRSKLTLSNFIEFISCTNHRLLTDNMISDCNIDQLKEVMEKIDNPIAIGHYLARSKDEEIIKMFKDIDYTFEFQELEFHNENMIDFWQYNYPNKLSYKLGYYNEEAWFYEEERLEHEFKKMRIKALMRLPAELLHTILDYFEPSDMRLVMLL